MQDYYSMADGAVYSGLETQLTYRLGYGFNGYVNGSINRAEFKKSKLDVPTVPRSTAAFGLIYSRGGFFGSLTDKYSGAFKVYDGALNPNDASTAGTVGHGDSYWIADLALGYGLRFQRQLFRSVKVKLQVNNLLDEKVQVLNSIKGPIGAYNVLPSRNYFLTVATEF